MFELMTKRMFCDAVIKVRDQHRVCHKIVLLAASPLLHSIIRRNSETHSDLDLKIDFLSMPELDVLLEILYTGNATSKPQVGSLLSTALEIFTDPKYAGISMEQAQDLIIALSSQDSPVHESDRNSEDRMNSGSYLCVSQGFCADPDMSVAQTRSGLISYNENKVEESTNRDTRILVELDEKVLTPEKKSRALHDAEYSEDGEFEEGKQDVTYQESDFIKFYDENSPEFSDKNTTLHTIAKSRYVKSNIKLPKKPPFLCPCQNCGKIFESHQRLRSHYRHTHGEKRYKCDLCPLRFLYPKDLRSHLRTHTGERPFVCEICGKGFSQMGSLTTHYKVHKKDDDSNAVFRPCPECSKKYCLKERDKDVDYLSQFSSMDMVSCICPNSNCAKKFSSAKSLRKHLRNDVCNPNKYHCGQCYGKFEDNIQLRYHVGTVHCTHKKRKRVKAGIKDITSRDSCLPSDPMTQSLTGFVHDMDTTSPILSCNVEEVSLGLLQLSEEVVIKGDE